MQLMGSEVTEITAAAPCWPDEQRLALCLTFNLESGEVAPITAAGTPNYLYRSTHQYGARRGVWNLLDMLARSRVKATFFVCGTTAEKYPETIREISERGHDIAGFTYRCENIWGLSPGEETEVIGRSIAAINKAVGKRPIGWRCPDFKVSKNTLQLLGEHGFLWDSDLLNYDLPYILEVGGHKIVEVPPCMSTYDKHVLYLPNPRGTARELFEIWTDEFEVLYEESVIVPKLMTLSCLPFLIARPAQLAMLEAFLEKALGRPGVWPATCSQIAHWWMDLCNR